jgi:outer membrane lipase/esterase
MHVSGAMMKSMGKWARRAFSGVGVGLAMLLAACGGGTERVTEFEPTRYIAFGDEMSVLTKDAPQGRKYSVNALDSDGTGIDCSVSTSSQPSLLWTQRLGNAFGFVFEECNPSARAVTAFSYAAPGAKSADFLAQLAEARVVHGPFGCNDLMSVLIGANDVIDLFENVYLADPTSSTAATITNELSARGASLGKAIAEVTDNDGPNIIVSTIPLVNLTPWARQLNIDRPEIDTPSVLRQFSDAFNTALRVNIPNDGSRWGLVELDALLQAGFNNPDNYGLNNVQDAVCDPLTWNTANCTTATLVANGNANTWLWASNKWMGWQAHDRLGSFARQRAQGNPFGCS